ncbi:MAG: DNA polymerase II large subunit [Candidatus Woesearchaeota archaeon]
MAEHSEEMEKYFSKINAEVEEAYEIANKAKSKGYDADDEVQVPLAKNMAERVEGLISTVAPEIIGKGIPERIAELEKQYGSQDWRVALKIAEEVAEEKLCKFEDKKKAIEVGIRVGFAYVTVGVVASPIEGLVELRLNKRKDNGKEYFCLMYSGPIRSAGGTGASVSALIADYVRKKMGYAEYDATEKEIKRAVTELADYHERVTNLQYYPSKEEVEFLVKHLPVQINGDPSEKFDVSNYKDLDRIETNRIRSGFCLMTAECLCLKAPKLWKQLSKWGKDFGLGQWDFLKDFVDLQKKIKAKGKGAEKKGTAEKLTPDFTYIKDIIGGRPVLTYPMRNGGFRLRYGRTRTSGFSSDAIHPTSMVIMDGYMAIGTQMKTERPGKATTLTICDEMDGPIVRLKNGNVRRVETLEQAREINKDVEEILYLGDLLINYGDFFDRAHKLVPAGFVEEWWVLCLKKHMENEKSLAKKTGISEKKIKQLLSEPFKTSLKFNEALSLAKATSTPLHPRYIYYWNSIGTEQFENLYKTIANSVISEGKVVIPGVDPKVKRALELIGIEHSVASNEFIIIENDDADAFAFSLANGKKELPKFSSPLEAVNKLSGIEIKDKLGTFIGGRMGRPEKAKMRKMTGSPQVLFPVGKEGGRLRSFQCALESNKRVITSQFPLYFCEDCDQESIYKVCIKCGERARGRYYCRQCKLVTALKECKRIGREDKPHGKCLPYRMGEINIRDYFDDALKKLGSSSYPKLIKGIRGTSNEEHVPEHLLKGILRARHDVYVNKDGTTRYDMTEMACTHFKPSEIGTPVKELNKMGYTKDCYGKPLASAGQIVEIRAQDIILPACPEALEEGADKALFKVSKFIDDLLERLYGLNPYYKLESSKGLVGHLCVAMSPHTSAGIVCRIIGFSKTQGFLAHPLLHSIMRRDCLTYETRLPIFDGTNWKMFKIGELVEQLNPKKMVDSYGTKAIKVKGFKTLGLNKKTKQLEEVGIVDFTKHKSRKILKLALEGGRKIRVTEDHKFCVVGKGEEFVEKKASQLKVKDKLITPTTIKVKERDIKELNLFKIFKGRKDIMVRGVSKQVAKVVDSLGGRTETRRRIKISKCDLDNFILRDSFPIDFLYGLSFIAGQKISLGKAKIAAKRDNVNLKPVIKLNKDVLWALGFYVAEGYARKNTSKNGLYQVDFAATEDVLRKKVIDIFYKNFGLNPSWISKEHIVFSSRILYELFVDILGCGRNAHEKRLPPIMFSLPIGKVKHFLRGYYDGDGSVSSSDMRVACDSVSDELLSGLEVCLGRYGIYTKKYTYKKKPGPKVREFYVRKKMPIPEFEITKLIVPSTYVSKFFKEVGFGLKRKQNILKHLVENTRPNGMRIRHDKKFAFPEVIAITPDGEDETYCLNVEGHIIFPNNMLTFQCDGDEAAVMLLMDHLLNFSKKFLPNTRGATQDAPLVLTSKLIPSEVDDMVFNMDVAWQYPLEFYEAAEQYKQPWDIKISQLGNYLGTEKQYEGMGFTHNTSDINGGVRCSSYKIVPSMQEKVLGQMRIGEKIRAVDVDDVARLVIERHFMRDIKGNLRKFSMQSFRCVGCNEIYRRPPLSGKCTKCGGKLIFTIAEGSIKKYLVPAIDLAKKYNLPAYLQQSLELTKSRIDSVFGVDEERQEGLNKWF